MPAFFIRIQIYSITLLPLIVAVAVRDSSCPGVMKIRQLPARSLFYRHSADLHWNMNPKKKGIMNFRKWLLVLCAGIGTASCIQDEALNVEAAIDGCTGTDIQLASINNAGKSILLYVQKGADLSRQQLKFTLPDGATIEADEKKQGDGGDTYDFSGGEHSRTFTVTSEDGERKAVYTIRIILTELPTVYHFERRHGGLSAPYDILYEENEPDVAGGPMKVLEWASGNPGFELTRMAQDRTGYPTMQSADGYRGSCVRLETRDTGSFGSMVKMYIAAGNLFVGNFGLENALNDPLAATRFGFKFFRRPARLTGYFKYKAGSEFTESGQPNGNRKDRFDIYAIFYEASDNAFMLNGANALTDPSLVAVAQIPEEEAVETDSWTPFDIPFRWNKSIDEEKLNQGRYKLGIVFSSSEDGDRFNGAVGSTLYIDEVELVCQESAH